MRRAETRTKATTKAATKALRPSAEAVANDWQQAQLSNSVASYKSFVHKHPGQEPVLSKLRQIGVQVESSNGGLIFSSGFPHEKAMHRHDQITIATIKGGIFSADASSQVPREFNGMLLMVSGGSFFPKFVAFDGQDKVSPADASGNLWVFADAGMQFYVCLPGPTNYAYAVETVADNASISFGDESVVLKDFVVFPPKEFPQK